MFKSFLGVSKMSDKADLPVVEEGYDPDKLPLVRGSLEMRQIHFFWDKNYKNKNNHEAIVKMATYTKLNGSDWISGVSDLLKVAKPGDLEE
jgi:hypothetical protein